MLYFTKFYIPMLHILNLAVLIFPLLFSFLVITVSGIKFKGGSLHNP